MRCFALILVLLCASCMVPQQRDRPAEEDDIREAVFRYQFDHNAAHGPAAAEHRIEAFYLSLGEKDGDPSDEFMTRFVGHEPPVRKVSACSTENLRVVDKQTGQRGLIFRVKSIKWISDGKVEVGGGYYEDGLSSSGNIYTVVKKDGKWRVTKDKMEWIS